MATLQDYKDRLAACWLASSSFDEATVKRPDLAKRVHFVLAVSTHKTYKYILVNGLLGANFGNNPLVLQAGSALDNAWDARSICHKVLVPFERESMESKLGGSNEPFLNKPARFPQLSTDNAVRGGKDRQALQELIELFSDEEIYALSNELLTYALSIVAHMEATTLQVGTGKYNQLRKLLYDVISVPCDGESLLFATGLILKILNPSINIQCHPSNQSGASSKEVGDIDLLIGKEIYSSVEVKDKSFTQPDFTHAEKKVLDSGITNFLFVTRMEYLMAYANSENSTPYQIVCIEHLIESVCSLHDESIGDLCIKFAEEFQKSANPKQTTISHINSVFR